MTIHEGQIPFECLSPFRLPFLMHPTPSFPWISHAARSPQKAQHRDMSQDLQVPGSILACVQIATCCGMQRKWISVYLFCHHSDFNGSLPPPPCLV